MVQGVNDDLIKLKNLLDSFHLPNVDQELSPVISKIAALKGKVDTIIKTARDIPNAIIQDFNTKIHLVVVAIMVVLVAFNVWN